MHLLSLASSFPKFRFSQAESLLALKKSDFWTRLSPKSLRILQKVLSNDNGIKYRHFAVDSLDNAWKRDAQQLNEAFEYEAPILGTQAVTNALERARLKPFEIDVLLVCTCTGFLCPGLSNHISEKLGLRSNVILQDITGHGCGAAIPLIEIASAYSRLYPNSNIVTAQVEVCSAAFHLDDDVGVLISACLFGDGASAQVWSGSGGKFKIGNFESLHMPKNRGKLRFVNYKGRLKNRLSKSVPSIVVDAVSHLSSSQKLSKEMVPVLHAGGRDILDALIPVFPEHPLCETREVLRDYGNISSASVFTSLDLILRSENRIGKAFWLCGYGAGFSAHCAKLIPV